jgi:hypothetical protein
LYVNNVGGHSYSATYGALAGIAIFMIYVHQTAYFFLLGAEMNQVVERRIPDEDQASREKEKAASEATRTQSLRNGPSNKHGDRPSRLGRPVPRAGAQPPPRDAEVTADPAGTGGRAELVLGRKVVAAGAAVGLAGMVFQWLRRRAR